MAAAINFYAGTDFNIQSLSGSGLGFYGSSGFGASVEVGAWQGRTYITNAAGTSQGPEADNVMFLNSASGIMGQVGTGIALTAMPNYQDTPIQVQNPVIRIYDRSNINNAPSGVTCKVAEIIHPGNTQANTGSGDTSWSTLQGSGTTLSLVESPGVSGLYANGAGGWTDTNHDWYLVISASPDSIGSKSQFGLYFSMEYL